MGDEGDHVIALIESLFGIKVPAWIVETVLIVLLASSAALYLEHRGAAHYRQELEKTTAQLVTRVKRENAETTVKYEAKQAANQETTDAAIKAASNLRQLLDGSVRDFDAYRRAHPDVARAPGQPVPAAGGECGAERCADLAVRLAERGDELAGSQGQLVAALQSCQRDRDSLTGLPR